MQKAKDNVIETKTWFIKDTGELFPYTLDYKKVIDTATESALKSAEPGILYWDRYIDTSFTAFTPHLHPIGVNGCVTGDTLILTDKGNVRIDSIVGVPTNIWNGYEWSEVVPKITGHNKEIYLVEFSGGIKLYCTAEHKFHTHDKYESGTWTSMRNSDIKGEPPKVIETFNTHTLYTNIVSTLDLKVGDELTKFTLPNDPYSCLRHYAVESITKTDIIADTVYCVTEPKNHTVVFNDVMTGNCSEFAGTANSACMLGSLNLANLVSYGVNGQAEWLDLTKLRDATITAISALNCVLNAGFDRHPTPEMGEVARKERQIGLGIMGLADLFIKLGVKYGSKESIQISEILAQDILNYAVLTSAQWAKEYGVYEGFNLDEVSQTVLFQRLSEEAQDAVVKYGLYNSRLLAIAPSGSISTMLGISSGIEPIYMAKYKRRTQSLHNEDVFYDVYHEAVKEYMEQHNLTEIPEHCVSANDVKYEDKIAVLSAWQKYTDNAISNTLNLPKGTTLEQLQDVYFKAWEQGLKGLSIYVDGSLDSQVLMADTPTEIKPIIKQEDIPEDTVYFKRTLKHGCGHMKVMIGWSPSQHKIIDMYGIPKSGAGCTLNITAQFVYISHILRTSNNLQEVEKAIEGLTSCVSFHSKAKVDKTLDGKNCATAILRMIKKFDKEMRTIPVALMHFESQEEREDFCREKVIETDLLCKKCGKPIKFEDGCSDCPHCGTVNCS